MSKKITLKHALPNGEIATRTTLRPYTHVKISVLNVERALTNAYASLEEIPQRVEQYRTRLERDHRIYQAMIDGGVGSRVRNWNNYVITVDARMIDHAREMLAEFPIENTVTDYRNTLMDDAESRIMKLKSIRQEDVEPVVISWHGSRINAEKATEYSRNSDYYIEEINHGVRA